MLWRVSIAFRLQPHKLFDDELCVAVWKRKEGIASLLGSCLGLLVCLLIFTNSDICGNPKQIYLFSCWQQLLWFPLHSRVSSKFWTSSSMRTIPGWELRHSDRENLWETRIEILHIFFLSSCRTTVLLAGYWKQPCVLGNLEVSAILYNRSGSCVLCREIGVVLHSQHTGVVQVKI